MEKKQLQHVTIWLKWCVRISTVRTEISIKTHAVC